MRRPALVLLLAALLAGCGSSGSDDDQEAAPIAAQTVVQRFSEVPGMPRLQNVPDASWSQLGPGLDVPPAAQERFGTFTIYVVDPGDTDGVQSLLADKDTGEALEADADGIYWDFDELAKSYVAQKRYGPNAVLVWWNEQREPVTDGRWDRLDAVMQDIASG
jgi:hypothetical protein